MKAIIYDCDPGVDDGMAIILALNSKKVDIKGITTVFGNSPVTKTTLNALRILDYLGKDIPVLAWGPGFGRAVMMNYKIKDIRELYWNDLKQLREAKLWIK